MKRLSVILIMIVLVISLASCGNNYNEATMANESYEEKGYSTDDSDMDFGAVEGVALEVADVTLKFSESVEESPSTNRMIIKSSHMEIETVTYDEAVQSLQNKIANIGGYIESSNVRGKSMDNRYDTRSAYYTIRIPEQAFTSFMDDLNSIGNILRQETYGEDISSAYFDTEAHVTALTIQEERLLEILTKAEKIEDVIELEKALSEVRYEIEALTGNLRRWDNLVSYATLSVSLYEVYEITEEVEKPKTLGEKINLAVKGSVENIKDSAEDLTIFTIASLPYLIIYVPFIILVVLLVKVIKKKLTYKTKIESADKKEVNKE